MSSNVVKTEETSKKKRTIINRNLMVKYWKLAIYLVRSSLFNEVTMTEIFDDEEKITPEDEEVIDVETEETWEVAKVNPLSGARRRLEDLLDEKKLKEELDDYFELDDL
jgi:hypothetical protein